jgi:hypothetical protein
MRYSVLRRVVPLAIWPLALPTAGHGSTEGKLEVRLSRVVRITDEFSGNYEFFRVATAPDNAGYAMVCTLHTSPVTNEMSGELFRSADGGATWSLRLRDASSHEVSEDACAFGEAGQAYFIAQPWNIKDPHAPHVSIGQSEMHFYRSFDYGGTWPAHLTTSFVDYARVVVDSRPGSPFHGRAYIAGNRTASEEFPFIAVLESGKWLVPGRPSERLKTLPGKHAQYPRSLIVLQNGDVLASYAFAHDGITSAVVTVTRDGGKTVDGPITVEADICGGMGAPSIAEDPHGRGVIAFYAIKRGTSCSPTIASSQDGGGTWKRLPISLDSIVKPTGSDVAQPGSITFGTDGIALITWLTGKSVRGALLDREWQLLWGGQISSRASGKGINLCPYVRVDDRLFGDANADMDMSLQFGFTNHDDVDAASQSDKSFLVVWRENDGQLYSRSIRMILPAVIGDLKVTPTNDVTSLVRYEARNINFDENTNTFEYDLELVNASDTPLNGPFLLKVRSVVTTIGPVTLKDVHADEIVFATQRSGTLLPGEHTSATRVCIQVSPDVFEKIASSSIVFPRVGLVGRVYAGPTDAPN